METTPRQYPPADCVDIRQPEQLGQPCEGCPLLQQATGCLVMQRGAEISTVLTEKDTQITNALQKNEELAKEKKRIEKENLRLLERLFDLQTDTLIDSAYTPAGFKDYLTNEAPEMLDEMRQGNWGVIRLDGRFVNYVNKYGSIVGDQFLKQGGNEVTTVSGLVRIADRRQSKQSRGRLATPPVSTAMVGDDRRKGDRRGQSSAGDSVIRQGGDEISLLVRNVTPAQLASIAARIQARFTVPFALERYNTGGIPFIASVGHSHAQDSAEEVRVALSKGKAWDAFYAVNGVADEAQVRVKKSQYADMWNMAIGSMPLEERPTTITAPSDRVIAEKFLEQLCPDFYQDPAEVLRRAQEAVDSESNE